MKHIVPVFALIIGIAMLVLVVVPAAQRAQARHSRTQEAEQIAARLSMKLILATNGCSQVEPIALQRACKQTVAESYPALKYIREAAANELLWSIAVGSVRNVETGIDGILKALETSPYKKSPASLRG